MVHSAAGQGGTGLGLALVHGIVEAMGGTLTCVPNAPQGTVFTAMLPVAMDVVQEGVKAALGDDGGGADVGTMAPVTALEGWQALVVEDNPINRLVLGKMLHVLGISVTFAEDGPKALTAAKERGRRFDVVFMDWQLPGMDGVEVTRRIRAMEAAQNLGGHERNWIMGVTANASAGDKERCLAAGMDDYLSKPIDRDKLIRRLRLLAGRHIGM